MLRSAASKVMWVGRATVFMVGLAVILGLLFGVASMAFARDGQSFILGQKNVASSLSTLVRHGTGPGLSIQTDDGPPLRTNSRYKVTNLNADRVDNKSANDISRVAVMNTAATSADLPADGSLVTYGQQLSITAPTAGFVRVNGNVTVVNSGCTSLCQFDAYVRHINSGSFSFGASEEAHNIWGNAGLDAVFPVNAGVNTFDIRLRRTFSNGNGKLNGSSGVLTAEYTPYDSTGTAP
jgi:hypothetical protein